MYCDPNTYLVSCSDIKTTKTPKHERVLLHSRDIEENNSKLTRDKE